MLTTKVKRWKRHARYWMSSNLFPNFKRWDLVIVSMHSKQLFCLIMLVLPVVTWFEKFSIGTIHMRPTFYQASGQQYW